jgi:hypothetical protein
MIESYYTGSEARQMWQGLKMIMDYKEKPSRELPSDASLPDEQNVFYARFEASNTEANQIKCIYIALRTSADISKCCTETQPKTPNSKQCRCRSIHESTSCSGRLCDNTLGS